MEAFQHLITWYECNKRDLPWRRTHDAYAVWVSEIMLQQTRAQAVIPYYNRFLLALPDIGALAAVDDDALYKLWQGLGYYSRAKNLKRTAGTVLEKYGGRIPDRYEMLLTLPGIGPYTAGAIASIAYGVRVPAVDGNVLRVMARLFDDDADITAATTKKRVFCQLASDMPDDAGTFNQAMMDLGAGICLPSGAPLCCRCPMRESCLACKRGRQALLPVRARKLPRRVQQKTVFVLGRGGSFLVRRRGPDGLLANLFELPNVDGYLDADAAAQALLALGVRITGELSVYERTHLFTHIEWRMRVYCADVIFEKMPEGFLLYDPAMSLPSAFSVCLPTD